MEDKKTVNRDTEVILASLKLARAMRRCPPERGGNPFPPAVGRLLDCAAKNPGVSSRELCEILDLRPSSLSEMLARAEAEGLVVRAVDETDRRVQRITLSEKGRRLITDMETARDLDARKKTACFTEEEKEQFIALANKLSEHMEHLALDLPEDRLMPPRPFPPHGPGPRHCPRGPEDEGPEFPGRPPFPPEKRFRC